MAPSAKGKEKVIYSKESAKRKRIIAEDNDGSGKKRNRAVLQFIEDAAYQVDEDESSDEDSMFDEDFEDEEFDDQVQAPFEPVKADPRTPKQERVSEEDFDKIMENRYKPGSGFVAYEEDKYETKNLVDETPYPPLATDAVIWKVKCTVGRERHSAFCLMQKYLDLKYLGTKLHTLSAFALDHVKGFIYIEADKQSYIYEACNGICSIYSTRATVVPKDEISLLFSVRSKGNGISEGMWARVKNGKYRGDLAQVVAVNDGRKKVTVKLIPRIDLRALAEKFGRGAKVDKNVIPAPRLISASELEEFRPLIQYRRDRDTNKVFEVLDGMMFKDGYLFKKVSADSLSLWGVTPTEDELLKFEPSKVDEGNDDEWLTQLYGGRKKKSRPILIGKGSGKGEGSSTTTLESNFEVHDLVFFWRKDFGVIIGTEKDDTFKIIKDGSEGPLTVTVKQNELRSADFDKKLFTALDQHGNKISINDTVRVVDGPLKDREGVVKRIYRGIVFIYNEASEENNGYICVKTQMCEKLESSVGLFTEKGGGPGISSFGDHSSPKSPLSPQISQQEDRSNKFDNKDDDAVYSIGQSLRIRVGPLKGYLCRVLAIRRSDVTVKLDSKHKIITVKCEHLSEVRGRSAGISLGADSDPVKPFEPREQDGSGDWMAGSTNATEGGNWNSGGPATERSSWGAFPTSNPSVQADSSKLPEEAADKDDSWTAKPTSAGGSSWGAAAATPASGGSSWGAAAATPAAGGSSWGATAATPAAGGSSWSGAAAAQGTTSQPEGNNWNKAKTAEQGNDGWGCVKKTDENTRPWGKAASDVGGQSGGWNKTTESTDGGSALNDTYGGTGNKADGGSSSWSKPGGGGSSSWNKPAGGFSSTERDLTAGDNTSGWGDKSTNKNEGEGGGGDVWNKKKSSEGVSSSVWGQVKGTETSNWNSQNDLSCKTDGNAGDWSSKIVHKEGSSSGWGQAKRLETSNSGGNQNSWGAQKSDNFQNSFGGGDDQSVPHDDKGRGGGQRGGRGGRWGSGRGRFGGNGMDSERDGGSWSGNKSGPVNQDSWGPKENNFGRSDGNNGGGWSSKKSAGGEGDAGAWGVSKSSEGGLSSGWGKDNTAGKSTAAGNQDSWGNKSSVKPDNDIGGNEGGSNGGWNSKKPVDGRSSSGWGINKSDGTNDAGAHQDSWGSKSNVEGGSSSGWGQSKQGGTADIGGSEDTWGKKTNADGGKSSGWGKTATDAGGSKDNWGKKNDGDGGSSSGWGQSKWGGAADAGGSGETWGKKSTWNSDSDNNLGGNEEDTGRGGGSWRGGSGGRWSSDRGGRSDSDRGGYGGGRGRSDRGGFGGRGGSDRGGFGGRYGSDEGGGFRGRGRSDRGGFRGGRDGSDRGGFRGRGGFGDRGRGRSSQNDSGEDKPYSWNSTADKGASWSSGNGGGSWGEKQNDNNGKWQSGGSAGWNSSQGASGNGGNSQAGGWNRGSGSTLDSGADAKPSSWKNASEGNGAGWSSNTSGGSWNSGDKGKKVAQDSSSDWNQSKGPSKDGGDGGNTGATGGWKAANSSGGGTSSTWGGQKADGEGGGSGSGSGAASWGKAPSGSWNQASGGSGKGGW